MPLLHDAAEVYGRIDLVSARGADTVTNHGTLDTPRINAVYADGSVAAQDGDPYWFGDCYGMPRAPNNTFPCWYMPYIRRAPFPGH